MTRNQLMEHVSALLDDIAERDLEKVFDEFVFDAALEECLRAKISRWKQQELAKLGARMLRGGETAH
jgi:hypothetical protein